MPVYLIDDEENADEELSVFRWLVSYDETGNREDQECARFKDEDDAAKFVEIKNG